MKKFITITAMITLSCVVASAQKTTKSATSTEKVTIQTSDNGNKSERSAIMGIKIGPTESSIDRIVLTAKSTRRGFDDNSLIAEDATYYIGDSTAINVTGRSEIIGHRANNIKCKEPVIWFADSIGNEGSQGKRYELYITAKSITSSARDVLEVEDAIYYIGDSTSIIATGTSILVRNQANYIMTQYGGREAMVNEVMGDGSSLAAQEMELMKGDRSNDEEPIEMIEDGSSVYLPSQRAMMLATLRDQDRNPSITNFYRYDDNDSLTVTSMKIGRGDNNVRVSNLEYVELITIGDYQRGYYRITDPKKLPKKRNYKSEKRVGFDLGVALHYNGLIENLSSMQLPDDARYMNLNAKSIGVDLNFLSARIASHGRFSLRSGLLMEINNFRFEDNIGLNKDPAGNIVVDNSYTERGIDIQKSKLTTVYLNVPLQVQFNIGKKLKNNDQFWLSAGGVMGLLIQSHIKVKTSELGIEKSRNDNNIRNFHYGLQAAIGYGGSALTVKYYPHSIFRSGQGPVVQQINVSLGCRL